MNNLIMNHEIGPEEVSNQSHSDSQDLRNSGWFNQASKKGKSFQLFQMIFLPFIPIFALIIQNSTALSKMVISLHEVSSVWAQVELTVEVGRVVQELQRERVDVAYYLFANESRFDLKLIELKKRFVRTDQLLLNMTSWLQDRTFVETFGKATLWKHMEEIKTKREQILNLRSNDIASDDEALSEMQWYNVANDLILDQLSWRIRETSTSNAWKVLIPFKNIIRSIENYSLSMVYGLYYFGKGQLSNESFIKYITYDSLAEDYLNATQQFSNYIMKEYEKFRKGFISARILSIRRKEIYTNKHIKPNVNQAKSYYDQMLKFIEELRSYQHSLRSIISLQVSDEMMKELILIVFMKARLQQAISAFLLSLVLLLSPVIIYRIREVVKQCHKYSTHLVSKTNALKREKKKSDRLLCQMLPQCVIRELRQRRQVPAEFFDSVTIYFSDIVAFTKLSSSSTPMEVVIMLNTLYSLFDSRIEYYDVYKVETIGDAYMVVSGLPNKNTDHAEKICTMALDIISGLRSYEIPHRPEEKLQIRIGVNTGSCVAGVVGWKMPRYCLFGDAINTASRLESCGESMMIHISTTTKDELDRTGGFVTKERGEIELKGKGRLKTYWLLEKIGGIPKRSSEKAMGFLKTDNTPDFLKEIFADDDED